MELTLISARDLKNTNILSKTKAYAVAWISNDHKNRQKTPLDKDNGTDPTWNHVMKFTLDEAALQQSRLVLEIVIYANSTFGDKEIGRVSAPLNEFLRPAGGNKGAITSAHFVSYQVRKPSGKAKGVLNLSVKLAEKPEVKQPQAVAGSYGWGKAEPVTAYPAGSYGAGKSEPVAAYPAGSYGAANAEPVAAYPAGYPPPSSSSQPPPYPPPNNQYPPPQYPPQAGYPPPPPHYQGYPPNQGYPPYQGYPPVVPAAQQPPKKNNRLGMGLGAGLLGGALGGLLLGDIVSDSYGGGFDGGDFGGGGFDGGF